MLQISMFIALILLTLAVAGCMYRVLRGPSMADRITALDTVGVNIIAIIVVLSMMLDTQAYLEVMLLVGILAFLGTVAFAKYIERGVVIEHEQEDRDDIDDSDDR
ncbi:Na(+)/H(+) antiporter subunit F1 [Paenibacillus bovis]|uniref:Cation:proton antiporter n=1 Tax=Paenibacillus bovis TaxID=1616788 RepID=A0A172ZEI2_9BACL|nr:Na(+)/H(+) antiporter subunit F1 [Paenibacillus bovis]ANF95903.1 cation:proton antiporter [Paenibacillus bovis]